MVAAKKLYPNAQLVMTDKLNPSVKRFLSLYRDHFDILNDTKINWEHITEVVVVDVATAKRIGPIMNQLNQEQVTFTLYDHHPPQEGDLQAQIRHVELVGATITLLLEEIQRKQLEISPLEATLFGLGLYTDTGSFTYDTTTARDLQVGSYLLEKGANLMLIKRFADEMDYNKHYALFEQLLLKQEEFLINGLSIVFSCHQHAKFEGGLATITRKLLETTGADAAIIMVEMQQTIYLVGRGQSHRINLLPLIRAYGGGGHTQAASATIKQALWDQVVGNVREQLTQIVQPAIVAHEIMSSPVKSISPETRIDFALELLTRYGHSGFPVVENHKLVGIISRRDIDKATRHGLGHAPVKAYMSTRCVTVDPDKSLEEILQIMIKHDIGRIPVINGEELVGIISRTNIIEVLHNQNQKGDYEERLLLPSKQNLQVQLQEQLPKALYQILVEIGHAADQQSIDAYIVGGFVRDLLLKKVNQDIDIVIDGDGIGFAQTLAQLYGGEIIVHNSFGTSSWKHPSGIKIDVTSSRFEYYEHPAALPKVEYASLKEDLYRRDFTINAMAIQLNQHAFGQLIDFYNGQQDLQAKRIRILHNLSFIEDPTRLIRAVRFELRFQYKMDEHSLHIAATSIDKIRELSTARIMNELYKLFEEEQPLQAIHRLYEINFWQALSKEISSSELALLHGKKFMQVLQDFTVFDNLKPIHFHFIVLPFFQSHAVAHGIKQLAQRKAEHTFLNEIKHIAEVMQNSTALSLGELHYHFRHINELSLLFYTSHPEQLRHLASMREYLTKRQTIPKLLTGEDLIKANILQGPQFSKLLTDIEIAYLLGQVKDRSEALYWLQKRVEDNQKGEH